MWFGTFVAACRNTYKNISRTLSRHLDILVDRSGNCDVFSVKLCFAKERVRGAWWPGLREPRQTNLMHLWTNITSLGYTETRTSNTVHVQRLQKHSLSKENNRGIFWSDLRKRSKYPMKNISKSTYVSILHFMNTHKSSTLQNCDEWRQWFHQISFLWSLGSLCDGS